MTDLHIPLQVVAAGSTTRRGKKSKEWRFAYVAWAVFPDFLLLSMREDGKECGVGGARSGGGGWKMDESRRQC